MDCIKNIGCYPSCNAIKFPYPALETGVHFVVFDWLGTKKTIAFEAVEGEQFYIPNYFNESSDPVFSIKQPSGDYLCWDKELEALAVCPDDCGKDCDFYRHFTLEINQTSDFPGQENEDPDLAYSDKVYNIDEAHDNEDGTFTINVVGAANGDLAVDDSGTFYEYQDGIWTVKFKEVCAFQDVDNLPAEGEECVLYFQGGKYWKWDGSGYVDVTPTIDFDDIDNLPNLVQSVNAGTGIDVDNTDPENPVVGLNQASQDSLDLADSAVQPGDNISGLNNDSGYLTEATHDALPQDNPHGVTKAQVGLGNVDNTSDANKPVSTAQGQAINQAEADAKQYTDDEINALNLGSASQADVGDFATAAQGLKADSAVQPTDTDVSGNDWVLDEDDMVSDSDTKVPTQQSVKAYVDANAGGSPVNLFTDDLTLTDNRVHDLGDNEFVMSGEEGSIEMAFNVGTDKQGVLYVDHEQVKINSRGTGSYWSGFRTQNFNGAPVLEISTGQGTLPSNSKYLQRVNQYGLVEYGQLEIPEYASDTDADNDSDLASGAPYSLTGDRTVYRKP